MIAPSSRVRRGRTRAALAGVLALAVTTVGLGSGSASGAATRTVCAVGCDFTSIAAAVTAAVDGDVVTVAAGTYTEPQVLINQKGITLEGAGSGLTIIDGGLATTLAGDGQLRVNTAASTSGPVTVKGLTIRNAGTTPTGTIRYAVQVKASRPDPSAVTFEDVAIEGIGNQDYGMYVNGAGGIDEAPFTFEDGSITGTGFHAILFENWRRAVTVEDSTFTEPTSGSATLRGFLSDVAPARVTEAYTFRRNTFTGQAISLSRFSVNDQGYDTIVAEDNTLTGLAGTDTGINIANTGTAAASAPTAVTVTGNRISGSGAARGISLAGNATGPVGPATVSGNSILGLSRGVDLVGAGLTGAIAINRNRLIQLGAGVNNGATSGTVNASENWWGCNAGPAGPGCTTSTGTGTTTIDTWIVVTAAVSPSTVPSGGTATVTADLRHLSNGVVISAAPAVFDGLETYYEASKGSVTPSSGPLTSGHAPTGTYTAPTGPTTDTVTVTIDGAAVALPVDVDGSGILGTVTSAQTGAPIAGLQVRLFKDGSTASSSRTTAADGTYLFGDLTTGSYEIWYRDVSNDDWVSEYHDGALTRAAGTPIAFTTGDVVVADEALDPKPVVIPVTLRTIAGQVTDPNGDPIPGIQVRLYTAPYTGSSSSATTDANGEYAFNRRPAGQYKLWFRDLTGKSWVSEYDGDAATLAEADGFALTEAADADVDATLTPKPAPPAPTSGGVEGTVTDEEGDPVV
ncbi:MAG TPA: carboxypeptidase regulatory-like domain-containing protein, partial [Iamia sp.]